MPADDISVDNALPAPATGEREDTSSPDPEEQSPAPEDNTEANSEPQIDREAGSAEKTTVEILDEFNRDSASLRETSPQQTSDPVSPVDTDTDTDPDTDTTPVPVETIESTDSTLTVNEESSDTSLGLTAPENIQVITITGLPVLGNVVHADGSPVSINEQLSAIQLAGLKYNAPDDYNGTDNAGQFSYSLDNGLGSVATSRVTFTITPVNDNPVVADQAFTIDETALTDGSAIVGTVSASDVDSGQTRSYSIMAGNDENKFAIDSNTGQITVANALDHETADTYSLTIQVTDNGTPPLSDTATITIGVNDLNDAPELNNNGSPSLEAIDEDSNPAGQTVSDLFGSLITDVDASSVNGIAVTAVENTDGNWEFSTDNGASWQAIGTVSTSAARLLAASDKLRFLPDGDYNGSKSISFRAWDQTTGTTGDLADTSSNGGVTAFSADIESATLTIDPVNDAPVLDNSGDLTLSAINEGDINSAGQTVSDLFAGIISDVDAGSVKGIAVTAVDVTNGNWQYSSDNGASWQAIGAVAESSALLLNASDKIRFLPNTNFNGDATFDFRAWDTTTGTAGTLADTTSNGGTTSFSTVTETATITINPVNDAPELDNSGTPSLTSINEDDSGPAGATVDSLFGSLISDVDAGSVKGIAITAADNTNGTWQYSSDNGATWQSVGSVSETSALLLDASDQLRFIPNANYNGSETLSFRAWDQTTGTAGDLADTSSNGGVTAFSADIESATLTIDPVNDAPVLDNTGDPTLSAINEGDISSAGQTVSDLFAGIISDVDAGSVKGIAVTSADVSDGNWQYSSDNGASWQAIGAVAESSALLLNASDKIRFLPNTHFNGDATFDFRAWDTTTGTAGTLADTTSNGGTTSFSTVTETATITINPVNDAPELDNSGTPSLTSINEDDSGPAGATVDSLFGSLISDVDAGSVKGIAITAADNTNGTWQYSSDNGATWQSVGSVSETSARLLDASDQLRFIPNANYNGSETLSFRAWDQTTGTAGDLADTSSNGGVTAFSADIESATLTIDPVNDAPVLDNTGDPTLSAINEGDISSAGQTVSDLFAGIISDVDAGSVKGIAVTSADVSDGNWQYSSDNGASWQAIGAVAESSALLLNASDKIRFLPNTHFNGDATFDFRAWDTTTGTAGTLADTTSNGGTTSFSTVTETATITINPVNDAPELDNSGTPSLTSINEDDSGPAGATVDSLFGSLISDVDAGSVKGIAITAADNTNGTWQYSSDNGATWQSVGSVSETSARLLDASDQLRFIPNANYNGSETLSFRGWDQTTGTAGDLADTSSNGDVTAFSADIELATLTIDPVNDAPVLDNTGDPTLSAINEGDISSAGQTVSDLFAGIISDVDAGSVKGIAVTSADVSDGNWQYSSDNGASWQAIGAVAESSALLLNASDKIRFLPNTHFNGDATFDFRAWDTTTGIAGTLADTTSNGGTTSFSTVTETATITINPVNDAPELDNSGTPSLTSINEDDSGPAGATVDSLFGSLISDVDAGSVKGIAITAADNTNGTWQYSSDNGATWQSVGSVSETSARLLDASDQLRFIPNANYNGSETLSFRGWDQTTGTAGDLADTSSNGDVTAFSADIELATLTIDPVNDAPVLDNTGDPTLSAINEGDISSAGQTVSDLFAGIISDVDAGSVKGIAVTSADVSDGNWQYSSDNGASWQAIGAVAESSALLLNASDKIRFLPNTHFNGDATFDFRAWDTTTGTAGTLADTTSNGGTTSFSTVTETATITINPVNDAPELDNSGTPSLTSINEDDSGPAGATVDSLFGSLISDVDAGSVKGIAITAADNTNGTWQYSSDNGATWQSVGSVSETSALLLDASDQLRFIPNANYNGSETLSFRAWDQTTGTAGDLADTSSNGGVTAFSADIESATLTIDPVNDAPELDTNANPTLTAINEDDASSDGSYVYLITQGSITDADGYTGPDEIEAMAITSVDNSHGTWQYRIGASDPWLNIDDGSLSDTHALLLDSYHKVRFVPDADYNGDATFDFKAWDRTTGTAGQYDDVSTNGGTTAFSSDSNSATITVDPVADAATISGDDSGQVAEDGVIPATASFNFIGTASPGETVNLFSSVLIGPGFNIDLGTVVISGDNTQAENTTILANQINSSQSRFTASTSGNTITLTANDPENDPITGTFSYQVFGSMTMSNNSQFTPESAMDPLTITGKLDVVDPDAGEAAFQAGTINGTYGNLTIDSSGNWTYNADNNQSAIQALGSGETLTDTITVSSVDNTTHDITLTITGINDTPTSLDSTITVTEDGTHSFTAADFNFSDADGDAFHSVKITQLPTAGTLYKKAHPDLEFSFSDSSDPANDTRNSIHGTLTGAAHTSDPEQGDVVNFSTSTDQIQLDQAFDLGNEWTISAKFKDLYLNNNAWNTLTRGSTTDHQIIFHETTGELGTYTSAGFAGTGFFASDIGSGWHEITAVGKGGKTYFYLDDQFVGVADAQSTSDVSTIGNYDGTQPFAEFLDDFQIKNTALLPDLDLDSLSENTSPSVHFDFSDSTNPAYDPDHGITSTLNGATWVNDAQQGSAMQFDANTDRIICLVSKICGSFAVQAA